MKSVRSYRFILVFFVLVTLAVAVAAVALAFGWTEPAGSLDAFLAVPINRWGVAVVGVVLILVSLQSLFLAFRTSRHREVIIQESGLGRVEIAASALEDLIRRAARQARDVREVKPVLRNDREGLSISLRLNINPEANLPAVSREVQELVQDYLEEKAGVHVLQVSVQIESVSVEPRARVE